MKKSALVLLCLLGFSTVSFGAIVQVPWDSATQQYYLKWEGYNGINYGDYDPDVLGGTYQKSGGDKWVATGWAYNYGQWTYEFVGGPVDNEIASVTVNVLGFQAGASNWHYSKFSTDGTNFEETIYQLPSGQASDYLWRGTTFGSDVTPLNVSTIYVRDIIWNGSYAAAVQTGGMEIIATPVPEPAMICLLAGGVVGILNKRRKMV
jgi:hypothetical protein